ncbi:hypothetical protein MPQ_1833 [Methylovorus sp. MP688]|nr:hypothetical protein MPQ_1833 [Methylovorus sp. MP688]
MILKVFNLRHSFDMLEVARFSPFIFFINPSIKSIHASSLFH